MHIAYYPLQQEKNSGTDWWVWQSPQVTNVHLPDRRGDLFMIEIDLLINSKIEVPWIRKLKL